MRKVPFIFILFFLCHEVAAQSAFKTNVTEKSIVVGEVFRVQYVLEGVKQEDIERNNVPPIFTAFRLVSSQPDVYPGYGSKPLVNIVYNLVALKPGRFTIPGISVKVNGQSIHSNNVVVQVISRAEAFERADRNQNSSEYFLGPDEDPYEKMKENLFMKVMVNKRSCYIGEPVVATFKLYSRLQSKSDIVKNPGFYGFSVEDIVSLDDRISNKETINGKIFDVHTVRMVQLYPLQAGLFTIDAMEVLNRVEFSRSVVNKKTEQEIIEGVVENTDDHNRADNNTVTYENNISTERINIDVKPYPGKNKPAIFGGATGRFSISAIIEENKLAKNEEGSLVVTVEGKGNFTQLSAPAIQWPEGIETFEPTVKDILDKNHSPLSGSRTFHFPFVASKRGVYTIPSIAIAFFDPDSNKYKTAMTGPFEINISDEKTTAPGPTIIQEKSSERKRPAINWWIAGSILIVLAGAILWISKKRKQKIPVAEISGKSISLTVNDLLEPAYLALQNNDRRFYAVLQKTIWDHLGRILNLAGSKMNKYELEKAMEANRFSKDKSTEILLILQECETAAFTKAEFLHDKEELLQKTRAVLENIR